MEHLTGAIASRGLGVFILAVAQLGLNICPALGLPPVEDVPEEVLRTEIITAARSPIDGAPISAAEYAALQEQFQDPNSPKDFRNDLSQLILLLQIRRVVQPVLPFLFE